MDDIANQQPAQFADPSNSFKEIIDFGSLSTNSPDEVLPEVKAEVFIGNLDGFFGTIYGGEIKDKLKYMEYINDFYRELDFAGLIMIKKIMKQKMKQEKEEKTGLLNFENYKVAYDILDCWIQIQSESPVEKLAQKVEKVIDRQIRQIDNLPKVVKVCVFYSGIIAIAMLGVTITKEIINTTGGGEVEAPIPVERPRTQPEIPEFKTPEKQSQSKITPEIYEIKKNMVRSQLVEIFRMVLEGDLVLTDEQMGEIIKQANDDKDGKFEELTKSLNLSKLVTKKVIENNTKFEKYIGDVILNPQVGNYPSSEKLGRFTNYWIENDWIEKNQESLSQ